MDSKRREALDRAEANDRQRVFESAERGDRFCVRNSNGVKLVKVTRVLRASGRAFMDEPGQRVVMVRPYNLKWGHWQRSEWKLTSGAGIVSAYSVDHLRKVAQVAEAEMAKRLAREDREEGR